MKVLRVTLAINRPLLWQVRQYNDSKVLLLKQCEARLHQATDYQQVLHREAVQHALQVGVVLI